MQVNSPQSKKKDPLELIMNGLQIAGGILGIRKDMVQTEALQKQQEYAAQESEQKNTQFESSQEEIARKREGRILPTEKLEVAQKFNEVPEGTINAVRLIDPNSDSPKFYAPKEAGLTPYETAKLNIDAKKFTQEADDRARKIAEDKSKTTFDRESSLRDDYTRLSQKTSEAILGFKKVQQAGENFSNNAYDDVALLYGYMKTIDPGAAVQEGDKAIFEKSTSIPSYITNLYNKSVEGTSLTPQQRRDVVSAAAKQVKAHLDAQDITDNRYEMYAKNAKVNPKNVVNNFYSSFDKDLERYFNPKKVKQEGVGTTGAAPKRKSSDEVMNEFLSQ